MSPEHPTVWKEKLNCMVYHCNNDSWPVHPNDSTAAHVSPLETSSCCIPMWPVVLEKQSLKLECTQE